MTDYRYASGEEPRAGDIVRSLKDASAAPRRVGDVFMINRLGSFNVWYDRYINGKAESFELIARAGEPVRYQPGDVVEVTPAASFHSRFPGRYTVTEGNSPGRNGVTATTPNGPGLFWAHEIKLVHRRDRVSNTEIINEALSRVKFTPPEPQAGDRVRVTFEATFDKFEGQTVYAEDDGSRVHLFGPTAQASPGFKIEVIERAEKPLAVGDRVEGVNGYTLRQDVYTIEVMTETQLCLRSKLAGEGEGKLHVEPRANWKRYEP